MIELDGSEGEGGGQILRSSLTLSLLTGKPFHLCKIRARRSNPGLQPQHLMCVEAAAEIGQAQLRGASKGSSDLTFEPGEVRPGKYHFHIGTAGATALVLHTLYLPLALRCHVPSEVVIEGGTHVKHAPCYHFLDITWRAYIELMRLGVKVRMDRPGFYPRGGGKITAHIAPCPELRPLTIDNVPPPARVTGISAVAGLPDNIAQRQVRRAHTRLGLDPTRLDIREESWDGGPGSVLALVLHAHPAPTLFFALGERGKTAEKVADEAAEQALAFWHARDRGVDPHSADQIILPLALAEGPSSYPVSAVTQHLLTNIAVIRQFLDRDITCTGEEGSPGVVQVR